MLATPCTWMVPLRAMIATNERVSAAADGWLPFAGAIRSPAVQRGGATAQLQFHPARTHTAILSAIHTLTLNSAALHRVPSAQQSSHPCNLFFKCVPFAVVAGIIFAETVNQLCLGTCCSFVPAHGCLPVLGIGLERLHRLSVMDHEHPQSW